MTFVQINRGPKIKGKPQRVAKDQLTLKWWANPTAPYLGIAIGEKIARAIGIIDFSQRVEFLMGVGDDAGKAAIRNSASGSWWCRVRGGEYCVFLDSEVSNRYFALFPRVEIQTSAIEVQGDTVTFSLPDFVRLTGSATA